MNENAFEKWKEQISAAAKRTRTPIHVTFELTPRCNLDCRMCYIQNQDSNALRERELSTESWKRVFDEAYDCGMMFASLTGGECLLRPDFKELYLYLWKKRVFITVMTNGTLLGEEHITLFKTYKPERVQISLYGSCEAGYQKVTGHKGFKKTVSAIRGLMAAKIPVKVTLTPSIYMKDDYISTIEFCRDNGFQYTSGMFTMLPKRDGTSGNEHNLSIEDIVELSIERALLSDSLEESKCVPPACGGECKEAPQGLACNAGKTSAVVSWDGRMCLCTGIPVSKASVLEMSYAEAWEKTKEAATEILLGMECVGCAYDKVCPKCPALRLTGLKTGHCNPSVCELTRKLVAAGVKKLEEPEEESCKD